jgi:succinoglycan biosynthesis transport protein ExoP
LPQIKLTDGIRPSSAQQAINGGASAGEQICAKVPPVYRYSVEVPFSQFAEGLRSLKVALDLHGLGKSNKVLGITSTLPNEGKSTIATNFASMIAHSGSRVILIDADLRNPSLSGVFSPSPAEGLVDVLCNKIPLSSAIWTEQSTGLSFIPAGSTSRLLHTNEILRSAAVNKLVDQLRATYDYVIVDLPPLAPVVDTRTTTSFIDSYVYVIEWGQTKIEVVEQGLAEAREVYERLLGVVLNKADLSVLGRYEYYRSNYYYKKYYRRYGYTE